MRTLASIIFLLLCCRTLCCPAQQNDASIVTCDTNVAVAVVDDVASTLAIAAEGDTAAAAVDSLITTPKKSSFFKKIGHGVVDFINEFSKYDTTYIEPQHFKFQLMGQMTSRFEGYTMQGKDGQSIRLSPGVSTKFGPYAGYSLIFLGYTLQLNNLYIGSDMKTLNMSLYTALFGVDFNYKNNSNFNIRRIELSDGESIKEYDTSSLRHDQFGGFNVKYWGFNTYYIFNHHKHSYPAAYNQSTCQKRSAGSPLLGIGFGSYDMTMDWSSLNEKIRDYYPDFTLSADDSNMTNNIKYDCYSIYGGYSYNWVFARNWLLGASATMALSYNRSRGDVFRWNRFYEDFKFHNLSVDGIGRMGLVWNNTRWFAGASATIHSYTYSSDQFSVNNLFGAFNIYFGINFGKKKQYRRPGKFFEF